MKIGCYLTIPFLFNSMKQQHSETYVHTHWEACSDSFYSMCRKNPVKTSNLKQYRISFACVFWYTFDTLWVQMHAALRFEVHCTVFNILRRNESILRKSYYNIHMCTNHSHRSSVFLLLFFFSVARYLC